MIHRHRHAKHRNPGAHRDIDLPAFLEAPASDVDLIVLRGAGGVYLLDLIAGGVVAGASDLAHTGLHVASAIGACRADFPDLLSESIEQVGDGRRCSDDGVGKRVDDVVLGCGARGLGDF
ncbi:hypothetical protein D3C76_1390940 [compost metagenome]